MAALYSTVTGSGEAELIIEKSKFIAHVSPASTKEEADAFIAEIRARYRDAAHNVPAMVIGDKMQLQWASDDGEPQGTSGAPMVNLLTCMGLTNTVIVVTRYFGGIKLGTGGLMRAYTSVAKLGIEAAGIGDVTETLIMEISTEYQFLGRIQNQKGELFTIERIEYTDKILLEISLSPEDEKAVEALINNATGGKWKLTKSLKKFLTNARR